MPRESTTGSAIAVAPRRPVRFEHRPFSDVVVTGYPGAQGVAVHAAMTGLWASRLGRGRRGHAAGRDAGAARVRRAHRRAHDGVGAGNSAGRPEHPGGPAFPLRGGRHPAGRPPRQRGRRRPGERPSHAGADGAPSGRRRRGRPHHLGPRARRVRRGVARDRPGLAARRGPPAPRAQPRQLLSPHRPGQPPRPGAPRLRPPPDGRAGARPRALGRLGVGRRGRSRPSRHRRPAR